MQVLIGDVHADAVVDTGGAYLVVDPDVAADAAVGTAVHRERIAVRGFAFDGTVHRVPVTIPADSGASLTFVATAFVPELRGDERWPLPTYLGWQGCLDRIRFAVDPVDERMYFGAAG